MSSAASLQNIAQPTLGVAILSVSLAIANAQPVLLNNDWKFAYDPHDLGTANGWFQPDFDDHNWETVSVPSAFDEAYDGVGWFRRDIQIKDQDAAQSAGVYLVFHQVDDQSRIYVNGQLAAEHNSYNTPAFVKLDRFLHAGSAAAERATSSTLLNIAVRVNDLGLQGGILQDVELRTVKDESELYRTPMYDRTAPSTVQSLGRLVMYSVYVRNFSPEGTFDGLRKRLPQLKALGVNVLWLLPIHDIGVERRKGPDGSPYAIRDYYSINPHLGTKDDFRALIKAAHAQGIRVIIDCVLNHTSPDSVLAKQHPDWFRLDAAGHPVPANPDWHDIVDLNWQKKEVWNYCFGFLEYWVREFDIDGYRADVADLIPGEFWSQLRGRLEKIKPGGILMLAESEQPQKHFEGFDLTYEQRLRDAAIAVLKNGSPADTLRSAILTQIYSYPRGSASILFVENHDKERAINEFGGPQQTKLAAVLTATMPGVPLLYTGTEVGASAGRDATFYTRSPVDFSNDEFGMRSFWTSLLALRARHPALQTGNFELLDAEPSESVLAFERRNLQERVLVILNLSPESKTVHLDHPLLEGAKLTLGPWCWSIFSN
jgi:glycosidase